MSDPFLGEIRLVGFNYPPPGWALCNGQLISIPQNSALFALLGTMYGGNGTSTFALPDLRGRVAMAFGQGPGLNSYVQGQAGGVENVTLLVSQMPAHSHTLVASDQAANQPAASPNYLPSNAGRGTALYASSVTSPQAMNPSSISSTGGSQAHTNQQPYLVLNYIIATQGIFPSRQ